MKIILSLLILLVSNQSFAQSYMPMPFGNSKWTETEYGMMGPNFDQSFCHFSMDTTSYIFSGHQYWKIETINDSIYNLSKLTGTTYLFNDSTNKKIYLYETTEKLIYDFSKNVGDTIRNIYCAAFQTDMSFVVDSIILKNFNGINRRVFYLRDTFSWISMSTIWIEGIGSPIGLFKNSSRCIYSDPAYELNCVHQNGVQLYGNSCYFKTVGVNDIDESLGKIKILPNPIRDGIAYLSNPDGIPIEWKLFSMDGKLLRNGHLEQIEVSDLSAGMYLLNLYADYGMASLKLVIE
ncbi:MAG TPA: T9SS type A sorting domain-containing protein [Chitinophagaceae bacterium]|nr:T9SS type A sorting domain-containing protein [Chitinophagaceae bacterium]